MTRRSWLAMAASLFGVGAARSAVGSTVAALPGFEKFLSHFPPDPEVRACSEAECHAYAGKLPDALLRLWREVGRGSYGGGLLFLTDPAAWEETLSAWLLGNIEGRYLIARSAFGDLFYYRDKGLHEVGGETIRVEDVSRLDPHRPHAEVCAWSLEAFFDDYLCTPEAPAEALRKPLFDAAVARLGRPTGDDGFFFVPALVLGGSGSAKSIDKGNMMVHLHILVQMHQ